MVVVVDKDDAIVHDDDSNIGVDGINFHNYYDDDDCVIIYILSLFKKPI